MTKFICVSLFYSEKRDVYGVEHALRWVIFAMVYPIILLFEEPNFLLQIHSALYELSPKDIKETLKKSDEVLKRESKKLIEENLTENLNKEAEEETDKDKLIIWTGNVVFLCMQKGP